MRLFSLLLIFSSFGLLAGTVLSESRDNMRTGSAKQVVLLGASVGRSWNIQALPERIGKEGYIFEYKHGGSQFDKSRALEEILARKKDKPDAVFLKECAAYFPGEFPLYKGLMEGWIAQCRTAGIVPIPTTVVPVTRLHPFKKFLIDIVKGRNPLKLGSPFQGKRIQSILEYNDWIRDYSQKNGLALLDLEAAVRYSDKNRYLREDLAKLDGLHLNAKAYRYLDRIVYPTLDKVMWEHR